MVYERALVVELMARAIEVRQQVPITVSYRGQHVGTFRADLVVEGMVLVELKALLRLEPSHAAQTLHALRATGLEVGLLLNFGPRPTLKRLIATRKVPRPRNGSA